MNFQELNEISKTFKSFKDNPTSVYNVINNTKKDELKEVYDYYFAKEKNYSIDKVVATRKILTQKLIRGIRLNDEIVNDVKNKIVIEARNNNYNKDIFHSWRPNWRILFPIYYLQFRSFVKVSLEILSEKLVNDLGMRDFVSVHINDFNGATNFGNPKCWFAIYNNTHSSQKTAWQLFFSLNSGVITYGLYNHITSDKDEIVECMVNDISYNKILKTFSKYIDNIKNDIRKDQYGRRINVNRKGNNKINVDDFFRRPINSTCIEQKHKKIQKAYLKSLVGLYGEENVILEENFIDIKVETNDIINLYEIKTYDRAIYCIRDAIGQLLLYTSRIEKKSKKQINLIVVGLGVDNLDSTKFKKYLLDNFNFNFEYKCFKDE